MTNLRQLIESDPALLAQAQAGEYAAVAAALNATGSETQPNPVAEAPLVPSATIHSVLFAADTARPGLLREIYEQMPTLVADAREMIEQHRATELAKTYFHALFSGETQTVLDAVDAALDATEVDPSWSATITVTNPSLAQQNGLGRVTAKQVQVAINFE